MTGFALKIIAILSMTIDHIGFMFFPEVFWLRAVGRLAFPIFALAAAEGARFTHDRKRYLTRLLLWGLISEIPFDLVCHKVAFSFESQNVCFTLAAGVACIYLLEKKSVKNVVAVLIILLAAFVIGVDYSVVGVLAVIIIHSYASRGNLIMGVTLVCFFMSLMFGGQIYCFLVIIPILFYNRKTGARLKYLFYIFYPLHMLIIWAIWAAINTSVK